MSYAPARLRRAVHSRWCLAGFAARRRPGGADQSDAMH